VTYLQFLGEWYNLPWLAAVGAGLLLAMRGRLAGRARPSADGAPEAPRPGSLAPRTSPAVLLVAAGILGLTLNGAIHDLRLGPVGGRFPLVAAISLGAGWLLAWGGPRLRHRVAPPITGLAFNRTGLQGGEAVVLSAGANSDGTARARHRDEAGVAHIVRIHASEPADAEGLRLGCTVRLGAFDEERGSYPATPV
jgi:hypothetical protein